MMDWKEIKTRKELLHKYIGIIPLLANVGKMHGYAFAFHGSMSRDLDIIAAPWTKKAVDPETLVMAIEKALTDSSHSRNHWKQESKRQTKPWGRKSYAIFFANLAHDFEVEMHRHAYIDLSVMPKI